MGGVVSWVFGPFWFYIPAAPSISFPSSPFLPLPCHGNCYLFSWDADVLTLVTF